MADGGGFDVPAGAVVMEARVDFEELDRDLREFDKKGEEAGQRTGEKFGSGFGRAVEEGGAREATDELAAGFEETGEKAKEAGERVESTDEKVDEMGETMETAGKAGAGLALTLSKKLGGAVSRVGAGIVGLVESSLDLLSGSLTNLGQQLQDQSDEFGRFAVAAEGAGRVLESVGRIAGALASAMTGARLAMVAGAGALTIASKRAMDDFVPSWNRVLTLIPEGTEGLTELRREVDELGAELGITAEVTNDTFYQVLSAMPDLAEEPAEALDVLRVSLEAAATGFTEADTAAKAITGVLNAFQMEASEARRVSDALFAAQDQGVLTFGEIASEISKVSGITNALGGDFEDLLAIVSTTTGELSQSVPETFTQVRGVIRSIVGPTAEAQDAWKSMEGTSGELSAALIREEGLIGALERVVEVTDGNPEAISRIIPRANAQTLVISLADRMDRLRESLEQVGDASGTTQEKLDTMMDSWEAQGEVFDTQIDQTLRLIAESVALGQSIEDAATSGLRGLNLLLGGFNNTLQVLNEIDDAIDSVTEDLVFDAIADVLGLIAQGSEETVAGLRRTLRMMQRVESQSQEMNQRVREAQGEVRLRLPPRGGMTEPGHPLTPRLPPREPDPIERPDAPTGPEFIRGRIEARRARMEVEAFQELIRTGDVEVYREELEDIQGVVNDLVQIEVDRLRQMGIEAERLQQLIDLYRPLTDEIEDQQSAAEQLLQTARDLQEAIDSQREAPPLPEGVERMDLGGARARVRRALGPLEEALSRQGDNAREVMEVLDEYGVSLEDLRDAGVDAFADMVQAEIEFEEKSEDGKEEVNELANELSKMASVTSGIVDAADAMGDLDDEARSALNSVTSLLQAGSQIAAGNFVSGGIQAAGALANIVSQFMGQSRVDREAEQLSNTLERLRHSAEALRRSFSELTGSEVARARSIIEQFLEQPFPDDPEGSEMLTGESQFQRLEQLAQRYGMTIDEFISVLESMGLEVNDLKKLAEGGETSWEAFKDEMEAAQEALKEWQMERMFEGFSGAMQKFRDRVELFDIEEPIKQLEALREILLEFVELPDHMEEKARQFDLSTEEGRRGLEEWIQRQWEMLAAGEISPAELGGMTPQQFREMLKRMEGTLDELQTEEGDTSVTGPRGFEQVQQVTEVTATRIVGRLSTMDFRLVQLVELANKRNKMMGGEGLPLTGEGALVPGPTPEGGGPGEDGVPTGNVPYPVPETFTVEVGGVTVGDLNFEGVDSPEEGADRFRETIQEAAADALDKALGERLRRRMENEGAPPRRF